MKTLITKKIVIAGCISILFFSNCSKDRIETEVTSYESMNEYFDSKKQEEQEYEIDTLGSCPLTGLLGTRICINKANLMFPNQDSVYFPYTLKLVELYTPKDMIYYSVLNNSTNGNFLCKSEIRVRTFKNNTELQLRNQRYIDIEMKDSVATESLQVFYENNLSPFIWGKTSEEYTKTDYGYSALISKLGWNATGKELLFEEPATLSFTSETDNLETVNMFVYLPDHESVYEISNHASVQVPIGETVKIIMMAIDKNNNLYHFYSTQTISNDATINVTLTEISDAALTQILDEL